MSFNLGLFGGCGPNPAATLIKDGEIVAWGEEERFNRIKMAPNALPISSINFCLQSANITMEQIDSIGFAWDCKSYFDTFEEKIAGSHLTNTPEVTFLNTATEQSLKWSFCPEKILKNLEIGLKNCGHRFDPDKVRFLQHHKCHAASAYYVSGFRRSLVIVTDGSGEHMATSIWSGNDGVLKMLESFDLPDTLGGAYATITEFLGFKPYQDEGKVMGLAPYGEYDSSLQLKLDEFLPFNQSTGQYTVNSRLRFDGLRTHGFRFTDDLVNLLGPPRRKDEDLTKFHKDLAFNFQHRLELIVCKLAERFMADLDLDCLCLAGGVAMNCKMNGLISRQNFCKELFVQPAASDNGVSLGAAFLLHYENTRWEDSGKSLESMYFGDEFSDVDLESAIKTAKLPYRRSDDIELEAAQWISEGFIVGWFQGRMEIGARALGNRSILASPLDRLAREKVNLRVKNRENWRPFCPSLTIESYSKYFDNAPVGKFMITAHPVSEGVAELLPSVVHVDGTARPQAVEKKTNPRYHKLLSHLGDITGHPVVLNTSFNIQGEPVVRTPSDAIRCFSGTGIDVLVLGDFVIDFKKEI